MKSITLLNPSKEAEVKQISDLLRRHGGIYTYYLRENEEEVFLQVEQKKNHTENYLSQKDLIQRIKTTFLSFTDKVIHVRAIAYRPSPVDVVTVDWIKKNMHSTKTPLKQLVHDFGVSKSDLSAIINEHKQLGQRTKVAFYYYFKSKELEPKQTVR